MNKKTLKEKREAAVNAAQKAFNNQIAVIRERKIETAKKYGSKYGAWSVAGKMRRSVAKFVKGDLQGDVYGLLEQVERCFPHWTTKMILTYTARYLREAGDNETADAILVTE